MKRALGLAPVFAALLAVSAAAAHAQLRTIPPDAKRGEMSHVQAMTVSINGKPVDLSAGAQIRDAENRVVLPTALPPGSRVKYLLSPDGKVHRAWILTPFEAAQPDAKK